MQELLRKIRQILKDRRVRRFFTRVVSSLAAIVVFVTTYALILPAITLEKTAICGIEEHQHSDSCYEVRLVCGQEESDGHHHEDSCCSITTKLVCEVPEHRHSMENECYDADGNLVCRLEEHAHDDSCYEEVRTLSCGQEEQEGHHHTDACYEKVLACGKEVHIHSENCYQKGSSTDAAADGYSADKYSDSADSGDTGNTENSADTGETGKTGNITDTVNTGNTSDTLPGVSDPEAAAEETQPGRYVPELDPLDMEAVLNSHTDFYYFHAEQGEEIPADSAEITDWSKVDTDTKLAAADLVKMYLAYSIPAGSLNETNPSARYRLPDNLHLSDEQVEAMNWYENGIAAGYRDSGSSSEKDEKDKETENYKKYLGAEAVEGVRRPDEQPEEGAQEFISAVVRAENVYDDKGHYLGQDLIFTFVPYSIEKNQDNYDAHMTLISAGEEITGWFACDFRLDQIDWEQEEVNEEDNKEEGSVPEDNIEEYATVIFAREDQDKKIPEISRVLKMTGEIDEIGEIEETGEIDESGDGASAGTKKDAQISKHVITADGKDYLITVTCGADSEIPENADLSVEEITEGSSIYHEYVSKAENTLGMEEGTGEYIRLFDISIVNKDDHSIKYQPKEGTTVDVCIELEDKDSSIEAEKSTQVVHFADDTEEGDVIESNIEGQTISFEADGFSIYAIIESTKRLQYNFYDGTNLLVSEYIKKHDNVLQELYDPGVEPEYGQTFSGWAYSPDESNPSNIYTIEQLNQQAADRYNAATEELTEINVYAIYDEAWYLRYMDQDAKGNATVLNVVRVRKDAADKNVPIDYTFTPEEGIVFEGWTDVATGRTYQQGDTITLDHHVDLYVKLQGRNWLVFDSNAGGPGSGATYTPPQLLIGDEATTTKPEDPVRRGYTFTGWNTKADGTGTWWYKADGSENRFGDTLDEDTTLYAQWEAAPQNYYVVFWRQKSSDEAGLPDSEKTYQYIGTETRNSTTGSIVGLDDSDKNRNTGVFENCSFNAALSDVESVSVNADGTTTLNVYYDLNTYVLTFEVTGGSGTRYRYDPVGTDNGTSTVYGFINGEWKQLTRSSSQNTVWYFRYVYTANNRGDYRIYGPTHTYTSRNNVSSGQRYNRTSYNSATSSNTYTGTRYTRGGSSYTNYSYSETTGTEGNQFGVDSNGAFVELGKATETIYSYTYDNNGTPVAYNGPIYTRTTVNNSTAKWTYKTISALYGHSIADQFPIIYNGSSRWLDTNSTYYSRDYVLVSIDKMPPANIVFTWSSASGKKTRIMNYYVEGLEENEDGYSYNGYTSDSLYEGTEREKRYKGYDTVLYNQIVAQYNFVTRDEDYIDIEGFTKWETDPAFNSSGIALNNNNNVDTINMYYKRNKYTINYISKGSHVTGQTIKNDDKVFFEASLADYGKHSDESWYYEPTNGNEGYFFAGWYLDEECTQPFDFANEKMPSHDITVYAKWDTYRVRVVLVPTVNNEHNDEVEFANNQSLSFRMDYNEEVSDTNIGSSVAKRAGYKLIGWYYTPDFDPSTEIHFPLIVNKDAPGVDMNYQSGEDWNKYGDNDGSHDNVRGILKLYAKWELDVDENSVYVEYDVDDVYRTYDTAGMLQTTIPVDEDKYALTNNNVTFQVAEAPTKYTSGFDFYRWVLLNPDGSESDIQYNPSDMASEIPSSFIYEETITDDLGNTATIKKIRLKAKFNIETEKVTTVTFDGNGGVTNDSAEQESVTESYPINKEFFMKDEDSFVREGYTLLGWAFEREDGSKITPEAYKQAIAGMNADQLIQAGIYQPGQKVAADNLEVSGENNWNPLENTVYAVWEINTYTVTVKKVVDGETAADKEFSFAASASGNYTVPDGDSGFMLVNGGEKTFAEVPYGTVLTFTETPASGYSIQSVDAKQTTRPDKTPLEETDYIDLSGADNKPYTIKGDTVITYINEKAKEQKLRIHKIGDDAASGLAGAKFDLTVTTGADGFNDLTGITSLDGTAVPANLGYLPGNDAADTTLFVLPVGTYTLSETNAPDYYDGLSGSVTLTVTADGITMSKGVESDTVELSEPEDGVYTLTVTDTRKLATVTVTKNVVGTDADKERNFSFSQTGLSGEAAFDLRGSDNATTEEIAENQTVFENVPYGTVFSVTENSSAPDFDTTIVICNEESPVTATRLTTGDVTVEGDVTITYTNTRNKQPVKVFKFETGTTPEKPLANAVFSLTGPEGTGISYTGLTTNADGYLVNGEEIIFNLPVNNGAYTLTETQAPAGYLIIGDGKTTFTVNAVSVAGAVAEMQTNGEVEVPTGAYVIKVQNSAGAELPSTGGSGTALIYLLGIMLTSLAGTGLVMRKRRKAA